MRDSIRYATVWIVVLACLAPAALAQEDLPIEPKRLIDLDVEDKPLYAVVNYIRDLTGENIVLGKNKDGLPLDQDKTLRVTIKLEGVFWETALKLVCEKAGAKVDVLDGNVWKVYQPPEVTLALENADVRIVVDTIARISGKNIVIGSDVGEGRRVTLRVSNLPWLKALKTVVESVGLTVVEDQDGLVYRIDDPANLKKELLTEVIPLHYLTLPSDFVATIKNELVQGKSEAPTIKERIKDFTLINALKEVISKDLGRIDYDLTSNSLLITDTPTKISEIRKIIEKIDKEPKMVQVDVKFISTRRQDVMNVGVNWPNGSRIRTDGTTGLGGMYTRFPFNLGQGGWEDQAGISIDPSGQSFRRGPTPTDVSTFLSNAGGSAYDFGKISFLDLQIILEYLKTDSQTEIFQKPTLSVMDNRAATIFVGESVRYAEVRISQTAAGGQAATIAEGANSPVDVGFQLLVKPHVIPDKGQVKVLIIPTLRDLSGNSPTQPGFDTFSVGNQSIDLPRVSASTVVTEMLLEDGETAVIGGLVRTVKTETVTRLPILGDIPLLGYLFKNIQTNKERRHIILFVTLRIMRSPKIAKQALQAQLRTREQDIAKEYYESIRKEKYERAIEEPEAPTEESTEESSSKSYKEFLEDNRDEETPDGDSSRPSRRRDRSRRW
ncbi:MAG: type II secretion system protein GspD [Planctomycetota bacterium]|jgi:type IV pilus assembly protein PilQ